MSVTGGGDRLLTIYNATRLELLNQLELEAHDGIRMNDVNFRHRSPLVGHFRGRDTGQEFRVVNVHLARGDEELRTEQARGLSAWAVG